MIDVGSKVPLTNGKYATVEKVLNDAHSFIIFYKGKEGESHRLVSLEEIFEAKPIDLELFHQEQYHTVDVAKTFKKKEKK